MDINTQQINRQQLNDLIEAAIFAGSVLYIRGMDYSDSLASYKLHKSLASFGIDLETEAMKVHKDWLERRKNA
jgi:hypothetical protein